MTTSTTTSTGTTQTVRCLGCGRTLTSATSIARRRGPVCHARVAAAARTTPQPGYKPEALDKAADLIEQAAIVPARRPGLYHTVSSDGTTTYLTHACGCTCPAGRRGRACYHRAAARILDAATRRTTRRATRSALRLAA